MFQLRRQSQRIDTHTRLAAGTSYGDRGFGPALYAAGLEQPRLLPCVLNGLRPSTTLPARGNPDSPLRPGGWGFYGLAEKLKRERERERCIRPLMHLARTPCGAAHMSGTLFPLETTLKPSPLRSDPVPRPKPFSCKRLTSTTRRADPNQTLCMPGSTGGGHRDDTIQPYLQHVVKPPYRRLTPSPIRTGRAPAPGPPHERRCGRRPPSTISHATSRHTPHSRPVGSGSGASRASWAVGAPRQRARAHVPRGLRD